MNGVEAKIYDEVASGLFVALMKEHIQMDGELPFVDYAKYCADDSFRAAKFFIDRRREAAKRMSEEAVK